MCCCEESFGASERAQAELSPIFQTIKHALDDIARFVEIGVIFELNFAVFAGRYAGFCLCFVEPFTQVVCVIPAVCNDGTTF